MSLVSAKQKNRAIRMFNSAFRRSQVAHHGLQRSGTNYLNLCMNSLGVRFINFHDPARNDPSHKHFRWQAEKDSIMPWDERYLNSVTARDIAELNRIAGFPNCCKHMVVKKNAKDWGVSILNWGLRVGWFPNRAAALECVGDIADDFVNYYRFWEEVSARFPEDVVVISFEDLSRKPEILIEYCNCLNIRVKSDTGFTGKFDEVPKSPKDRQPIIGADDIVSHPALSDK